MTEVLDRALAGVGAYAMDVENWTFVAINPERLLTLEVAVAVAKATKTELLRVHLWRSRKLRVEHIGATGKLLGTACWPEREGTSTELIGVEHWPLAATAEPVVEHLAERLSLPEHLAGVPSRGWRGVGKSVRRLRGVRGASAQQRSGRTERIVGLTSIDGPLAAALVFAPGVTDIELPKLDNVTFRFWPVMPRWGGAGRAQLSARVKVGADASAKKALLRWFADVDAEVSQAVFHESAWNPLLQVDMTPWELGWGLPPGPERVSSWPEKCVRGAGDAVAPGNSLLERLGSPPDGVRREGRLIHRAQATQAEWLHWLQPRD